MLLVPQTQPIFWRVREDDSSGMTLLAENTGVSPAVTLVSGEGEVAYLAASAASGDGYPPLPAVGEWLEHGEIYEYGGTLLMVRQSHSRTIYEPADTPALFVVWRGSADEALDWLAGEQVQVGTRRSYGGVLYEAIQAHVTQADWTPPATPALWRVVVTTPTGPQPWVQPTGAHDAYPLGALVTHRGFVWESLYNANVWEPGLFGWRQVGPA